MLWLVALVLVLQTAFHWLLEPVIRLLTPLFELNVLPWLFAFKKYGSLLGTRSRSSLKDSFPVGSRLTDLN